MNIIEMNEGRKIDYTIDKTKINFNDELMLNLAKYEQDRVITIDICSDINGNLSTAVAFKYVAQIEIPARKYIIGEADNPEYNEDDEQSKRSIETKELIPFDIDKVTLRLWSVE